MPISTPPVSVTITGLRTYSTFADTLDAAIGAYRDESRDELVKILKDRTALDFSDVRDRSALLVVIADYEGF